MVSPTELPDPSEEDKRLSLLDAMSKEVSYLNEIATHAGGNNQWGQMAASLERIVTRWRDGAKWKLEPTSNDGLKFVRELNDSHES